MSARVGSCPCCRATDLRVFYEVDRVPVNSVLMLPTSEEARAFPTGEIALAFCAGCGFIFNAAFDPALLEYSERYDPTQAFSETFNAWHRELANTLIERYGIQSKRVIEIGCGKGEFLNLLCELGDNEGVGFDPAYDASRDQTQTHRARFVTDFYSEKYADVQGDFVCCKMTLEHIQPASSFVQTVRRSVGDDGETIIFFQVPDVLRILEETAFWDIYYEHCSYYSVGSLARLFRRCGFEVMDLGREYDDQYLMVEARPAEGATGMRPPLEQEADLSQLAGLVESFRDAFGALKADWQKRVEGFRQAGKRVVIWGSGSKGVAFLTTLGITRDVEYVVDINPHRQGYYMAGTGQRIVAPEFLQEYRPDVVVVMNPIYRDEIVRDLTRLELAPEVITT